MRKLPNGKYEITNKKTGEKLVVNEQDLPKYGLTPQSNIGVDILKSLFVDPIKNTVTNTAKDLELMGGGAQSISADENKYNKLPDFFKNFVYSPQEVQKKFATPQIQNPQSPLDQATNFAARLGPSTTEGLKRSADVGSYFLPVDQLVGKIGAKVGGAVSKVPLAKFITPAALREGIGAAKNEAGRVMGAGFEQLAEKGATVETEPVLKAMGSVFEKAVKEKVPGAPKAVQKAIDRVAAEGASMTAETAHDITQGFWKEIFGEAGAELKKRGAGIYVQQAKKLGGGKLSEGIKDVLKQNGLTDAADAFGVYRDLGLVGKEMEKPFKNWWIGAGVTAGLSTLMGLPREASASLSTAAGLLTAPWTRNIIQKSISTAINNPITKGTSRVLTIKALNELLSGKGE